MPQQEYTGKVEAGGPAQVRELPTLTLRKLAVGGMDNNTYLLTCRATGEQLMVDAAAEPDRLLELVAEGGGGLAAVVTTHRHHDHVGALAQVVERTGAQAWAGAADADLLPVPVDRRLEHGERITVGAMTLDVIGVRGHTPGGIVLAHHDGERTHLITGDSLFPGGVGATNHPDHQSFDQLIDDVEHRLFDVYEDDTWFYPGHGADSTLGAERPHLAQWRARGW